MAPGCAGRFALDAAADEIAALVRPLSLLKRWELQVWRGQLMPLRNGAGLVPRCRQVFPETVSAHDEVFWSSADQLEVELTPETDCHAPFGEIAYDCREPQAAATLQ